jgi:hypothetical protein
MSDGLSRELAGLLAGQFYLINVVGLEGSSQLN